MISNLKLSFFRTYIFLSFSTNLSSIYHSFFLNTLTLAFFISSTTFTTSLFFASDFLIFSMISSLAFSINNCSFSIALISNHFFFQHYLILLSLFTPSAQSALLFKLFACSILFPATYFKVKSNLNKYNVYLVCLWFNF